MQVRHLGAAVVSVDLTFPAAGRENRSRGEGAVLTRLIELFDMYEVAATWAAIEPDACEAVESILAAQMPHELALLGDSTWIGVGAGRTRFAQELRRRLAAARGAGLTVHTLAAPNHRIPREHADLLVRSNVAVVRQSSTRASRSIADLQPQSLRHGVWQVPPAVVLPQTGLWFGKGAGAARRTVQQAMAVGGVAHIVLDLGTLTFEDPRLQSIESLLRFLARACGCGAIRTATLGRLAGEWSRSHSAPGARSILRAA